MFAPYLCIDYALVGAIFPAAIAVPRINALVGLAIVSFAPNADHDLELYAAEFAAITGFVAVYLTEYRTSILPSGIGFIPR